MADFKRGGFRGGAGGGRGGFSGGGDRPRFANKGFSGGNDRPRFGNKSFGGPSRDSRGGDDRPQMFTATCAECSKSCEVPFRPNGERPVFCRDCFGDKRGTDDRRAPAPRSFEKREFTPSFAPKTVAAAPDARIDDLKRQVETINKKLDNALAMLESLALPKTLPTVEVQKTPVLAKVVKKVVAKAKKASK